MRWLVALGAVFVAGSASGQFATSLVLDAGSERMFVTPLQIEGVVSGFSGGQAIVEVTLDTAARQDFADFTGTHLGRPVSVQLCGAEVTRPVVSVAIRSGLLRLPARNLATAEVIADILQGNAPCAALNE